MKGFLPWGLALLLAMTLPGCNKHTQTDTLAPPLRFVKTYTVTKPSVTEWRELPGKVSPSKTADLSFRISGKLEQLAVAEGDRVEANQLLAKLDTTDAEIQLKKAQADYEQKQNDFQRGNTLLQKGVLSQADFDKLKAAEATTQASLSSAEQTITNSYLRAPFSGRVAKRLVNNYEEVSAMQTVVVVQDLTSVDIKVDIPENIMISMQEGAEPKVYAYFDAIPNQRFELRVKEVATQADAQTNTFEATMTMPNVPGYNILPGMSVTVRGERRVRTPGLGGGDIVVPAHAVVAEGSGRYVYLLAERNHEAHTATVKRQEVETGVLTGSGLVITSGVNLGDELVVAGVSKMRDGLQVRLPD